MLTATPVQQLKNVIAFNFFVFFFYHQKRMRARLKGHLKSDIFTAGCVTATSPIIVQNVFSTNVKDIQPHTLEMLNRLLFLTKVTTSV